MRLKWLVLISVLLLLVVFSSGCGYTGCSAPSFSFATAAKVARGWVTACLNGQTAEARQYWTRVAGESSDQVCKLLGDLKAKNPSIQILSVDEPISFLCMRQVYVTLQRGDQSKGLLVFFVESGSPSSGSVVSSDDVVLMGALFGAGCPIVDTRQQESQDYFDSCFWYPVQQPAN